jgi:membrane-associated protease RseP (regulator of RpoE activity)
MSPRKPGATFVTIAGGPLVNLVICIGCAVALEALNYHQSWNPLHPGGLRWPPNAVFHLHWVFLVSYYLLLFNLLPIYALDGGQILHTLLWPSLGWHQAMMWTCIVGMVGAVPVAIWGLFFKGGLLLSFIMLQCFLQCLIRRRELVAMGPGEFETDEIDYSQSLREPKPRRRKQMSRRKIARLRREAQREATEAARIDAILAKVSERGMNSLTYYERRILKKATERQRRRELEMKQQEL